MQLKIDELKDLMAKISAAVEKSKINPKSGWIELLVEDNQLLFKVSNSDSYYLQAYCKIIGTDIDTTFHVTVLAETFIPLVSKFDEDTLTIYERLNVLILETASSTYTLPTIKELGKPKSIDAIPFKADSNIPIEIEGKALASIADINLKGYVDSLIYSGYASYIYIDEKGAITATENIYVNDFEQPATLPFKLLLTPTQVKLLDIFKNEGTLSILCEEIPTYYDEPTVALRICIYNDKVKLILNTQPKSLTDTFPSIKARAMAENINQTHIFIDKKALERALTRLMIFDKKFDVTVIDYSKLVFKDTELELVSIRNKNSERIPYVSSQNVIQHESVIRFIDLQRQLKAVSSKNVDISYGSQGAIVLNSTNVKQIIPEMRLKDN